MTPKQYAELLEYIQENNSWAKMRDCAKRNRRVIKYIDAVFDSRTGDVWHLTFRQGGFSKEFRIDKPEDVKSVYEWLDEKIDYKD